MQRSNTKRTKRKAPKIRRSAKKRRRSKTMQIYVVDEHNDAMLPFLDAVKTEKLPRSGVKMLHYDSHPDLGNIEKGGKVIADLSKQKVDKEGLHDLTDIATWITPLCLAGFCDEVIWVAGHWCPQIEEGTYDLVCGIDSNKALRTASADGDNEKNSAVTDYWECDGTAADLKSLKNCKTWKLHVFKHDKRGQLSDESFDEIIDIIGKNPWVLDIDEDFFSCNNPHRDDFSACFGLKNWQLLRKIYEVGQPYDENLEKVWIENKFLLPQKKFLQLAPVKQLLKVLKKDGAADARKIVTDFQKLLIEQYEEELVSSESEMSTDESQSEMSTDESQSEVSTESDPTLTVSTLFDVAGIHNAGLYTSLPHHLTKVKDIVEMGNTIQELLKEFIEMKNNPIHVTLATSRADRYLPDCQADIIHGMLEMLMEDVYENIKITRMDKPQFSINFIPDDED